jgi:amino acid adenylation domain-containing protein
MNLVEFLASLANVDIRLWVDAGNLRFSAPEGAMSDDIKQKIIANKPEIIAFLQQSVQQGQQITIESADRSQQLPLSFAQERFWFLYQLEPESSAYNMAGALRIKGQLRVDILNRALSEIVNRHEILRTRYIDNNGIIEQHIDQAKAWGLSPSPLPNSQQLDINDDDALVTAIFNAAQNEANKAFKLEEELPIRGQLHEIAYQDHLLLVTLHHIASDGWSMGILVSELAALYNAIAASKPMPLPELPIQYADYAVWQREHLSGEVLEKQQLYWNQKLAGISPLNLPTDYSRPPVAGSQGDSVIFEVEQNTTASLKTLAQKQGATLFMTLMAAFKVMLARYSRQDDICVGTPIANRNQASLEPLIGCFLNTLAIRTDLSGKLSFNELIKREQTVAQEAFEHQDIPFAKVIDGLNLAKDMAFSPVYQTMFVLQNAPADKSITLPGLTIEPLELEKHNAQFDLKLSMNEIDDRFIAEFEYRTELFQKTTILRMTEHFKQLLNSIIQNPDTDISELAMITQAERLQLMSCDNGSWNDTAVDYGQHDSIHQLFEQQVAKTPHATALRFKGQTLSFEQLNQKANQLAHFLVKEHHITPDTTIAVCMQRSLDMSIALMAILKAGGCYLPCDPGLPKDRLAYMLEDTQAPLVLTQSHLKDTLPDNANTVITLNTDQSLWAGQSSENPLSGIREHNLFNIIYTSGSTGRPKGVMVPHGGIINRLLWMQKTYPLSDQDVVLQKTPYSFDVSVWELFWPLITGAVLTYAEPEGHKDPSYLRDLICAEGVTTLHFVPSMLGIFLQTKDIEQCDSIQRVFCSGEALQVEHQRRFLQRLRGKELHNLYGPTEASIDVSYYHCTLSGRYTSVPIGKPVANTQLHVLDSHLQPMPVGVPGELYIGGVQLARGYLNRAELTTETFISNPYYRADGQGHPSPRLYKTGDLARWLPDGNIEYIGRTDHQVKIRGLRIELGEIEAELNQLDSVKECVVVAAKLSSGSESLVAYLIAKDANKVPDKPALSAALAKNLPDYMVPSTYMWLDSFPLSANGKLDRKALPAPDFNNQRTEYVAPRSELEAGIAAIWQDLLKVERVGIHDSFFELGGHSLLATQFISRLRQQLQQELALKMIFTKPTIAGIVDALAINQTQHKQPAIKALDRSQYPNGLPLSYAQQRLWLIDQLQPGSPMYNIPLAVTLEGKLNITALEQTFASIIRRHESLRTNFAQHNNQPVQVIHQPDDWSLPLQIVNDDEAGLRDRVSRFMRQGFNLANDPLIRVELWQLADSDKHLLLLNMHHIISDGWSMDVLIEEVFSAYQAFSQGSRPDFKPLDVHYADYAVWQKDWLQGEVLDEQINYWRENLNNVPVLELPTDKVRPPVMDAQGYSLPFELSENVSSGLRKLASEQGATLFMTALAAFKVLLSRYSGQDDICVGTPIANRTQASIEPLIGFFVNTLAIRTYPKAKQSFKAYLNEVKQSTLDAYSHQDVSFEHLVDELKVPRDMSHSPVFQAVFALQNLSSTDPEMIRNTMLGEASLSPYTAGGDKMANGDHELHETPVKFDLHMGLQDHGDKISGELEFRHSLFNADTMRQFVEHFQNLLQALLQQPDQAIGKLDVLSAREQQQLLVDWNQTQAPVAALEQGLCVHQLIEQQVNASPDATAVIDAQQSLSYRELNQKANQLGAYLHENGLNVGDRVGVCLPTSAQAMVAILATLKAGGAYVPMDISYPNLAPSSSKLNMSLPLMTMPQTGPTTRATIWSI